ncbi:MATE family efflux transporter [Sporanaerobium hydrogeniformans]|uniref:MATE family efflux transporter n=1 Tax=Sporanaerobium hydrogeniformans TaxID=3072179 RepID=A0AC61D8S7_9FIRM|nr:MATE family efflux transporter [Sporanaerobium hydrogeniformans]PHV69644.1 MATE family efflux transporter [Sporanaerobium hydrogeniformans]
MKNTACLSHFIKYVSLNVLGMIGLSCYILADTYFVSKGLGANGLTALNLAIPIYSFIHGSGLMLGMGGATRYSIAKSQSERDKMNQIFTNTILLALSFAGGFFVIGFFFSEILVRLLGADVAVFQMSKTYLQVVLLFAPIFIINNVLLCFVRNDGAPELSMIAMLGGSFSNIILDYIFMFPLKMGIFGAVLATGLAPAISLLILCPFFLQKRNGFHLINFRLFRQLSSDIFSSGMPSLITEVSSGIVIIVFNTILLKLQGNMGVAAYGIIANLSLVMVSIYTGIAQGIQPLISSNYGIGNHSNVQTILRYALLLVVAVSGMIYMVVFIGGSQIISLFNSEQNEALQSIAMIGLKIYFTSCLFVGFNIIISVYFTSIEYARPAHIISVLRGFLIIIPLAFLLASFGGILGVWCVFPTTELLVAGIGGVLYLLIPKEITNSM